MVGTAVSPPFRIKPVVIGIFNKHRSMNSYAAVNLSGVIQPKFTLKLSNISVTARKNADGRSIWGRIVAIELGRN
jgi:hypothetical protein